MKVKSTRSDELKDIREVLSTEAGKRFVWSILSYCKTFQSIWEPSARIHYMAGVQDVGHHLMTELEEADPKFLISVMEQKIKEKNL